MCQQCNDNYTSQGWRYDASRMENMYKIIAFSCDGEYITEGEFSKVNDAWYRVDNWGSRWIFYPIVGIIKQSNKPTNKKRVVDIWHNIQFLKMHTVENVRKYIANNSNMVMELLS